MVFTLISILSCGGDCMKFMDFSFQKRRKKRKNIEGEGLISLSCLDALGVLSCYKCLITGVKMIIFMTHNFSKKIVLLCSTDTVKAIHNIKKLSIFFRYLKVHLVTPESRLSITLIYLST